jgi:hypothetical protein
LSIIPKPKFAKIPKTILLVFKVLLLSYSIGYGFYTTKQYENKMLAGENDTRLKGLYEVESFQVNNDTIKTKSESGIKKWKYLMLKSKKYAMVKYDDNKRKWYKIEVDSIQDKFTLEDYRDSLKVFHLNLKEKDSSIYLNGTFEKDTIAIKLKKYVDFKKKFMLTNTGFNWINERPNNR